MLTIRNLRNKKTAFQSVFSFNASELAKYRNVSTAYNTSPQDCAYADEMIISLVLEQTEVLVEINQLNDEIDQLEIWELRG